MMTGPIHALNATERAASAFAGAVPAVPPPARRLRHVTVPAALIPRPRQLQAAPADVDGGWPLFAPWPCLGKVETEEEDSEILQSCMKRLFVSLVECDRIISNP